ncbi:MAG: hypothetical protein ABG776_12230 [Cyanobacteria bacterium J06555_13]
MESKDSFNLNVRKICQSASGGSYVVVYDADVTIVPVSEGVQVVSEGVQVLGIEPEDPYYPMDVQRVIEAIRSGAQQVLTPRVLGAVIRVNSIAINIVDFKPRMFEKHTALELERMLVLRA